MKVKAICESCEYYIRCTYSERRKPVNYHAIGQTWAFAYCKQQKERCMKVKTCQPKKKGDRKR